MEAIGNAPFGGQLNHGFHHVAAAGHHKANVFGLCQHLGGCFHKVFRPFLHGDAAQEGDHPVATADGLDGFNRGADRLNGIVNGGDFVGVLMVFVDDGVPGEIAHTDDVVGMVHAVLLDAVHLRVHLSAASVEIGGVDVDDHRLATHVFGVDTCWIGEPVVGMDDVELLPACDDACADGVIVDFFQEVVRISAGKLDATQIVHMHVIEICVDVVAQFVVFLRVHDGTHPVLEGFITGIAPNNGRVPGSGYLEEALVFVAVRFWYHKDDIQVGLQGHSSGQTVTGRSQSPQDMRGKLPSEHQCSHIFDSMVLIMFLTKRWIRRISPTLMAYDTPPRPR